MQKFNYHTHTYRCGHSDQSISDEVYVVMFLEKGFTKIAFTDHCEVDAFNSDGERNVRQAFFEIAKAKSAFTGKLLVLNGIELGQPAYDIETAEKILASQKFDIVIGSVHNLRKREDFYYIEDFSQLL